MLLGFALKTVKREQFVSPSTKAVSSVTNKGVFLKM